MKKVFNIVFCFVFMFALTACAIGNNGGGNNQEEPKEERYGIPEEINASITMPEIAGASVVWESNQEDVLTSNGWLFMPEVDTEVVLTAHITKDGKKTTEKIKVLVRPSKSDPFTTAYKMTEGRIKSSYYKNGNLDEMTYKTYTAIYESLDQDIIASDGTIYQTDHDQEVTIRIKIINNDTNEVREYYKKTVVLEYSNASYTEVIGKWVDEKIELYKAGQLDKLPLKHEKYPSKIEWISGKDVVVTDEGVVIKPIDYVDDTISCQITYQDAVQTRKYELTHFGGNTEEGFLDAWLPYIMPKQLIAHKNYVKYDAKYSDYFFYKQIEVYTGAVLNLIDGQPLAIDQTYFNDIENVTYKNRVWYRYDGVVKHPALKANATDADVRNEDNSSNYVTQSYLDKAFYPGYVIPNEENIIWIVVHESGMPRPGEDAKLLAETQVNTVRKSDSPRSASWHYQVDHGVIYQSFPDVAGCWHAGGTHPSEIYEHCNSSSIGIEMCINADGNYDGAMHHDTKLVAMLCNKYNLNIDNIKRHYDMSGKECPAYMIRTNRWNQFLEWTTMELNAIKYLKDATVTWTVPNLNTLFTKGGNGLYYAKAVSEKTDVTITLDVVKGNFHFNKTVVVSLYPDTVDLTKWEWVD